MSTLQLWDVTKVFDRHEYKVFPPGTDYPGASKAGAAAHIDMRCRDFHLRLDCERAREFVKFIPEERWQAKKRSEGFPAIYEFIEEEGGEINGITCEKLCMRGEVIDDPEYPDETVFTLERHTAILGDYYTPGEGMNSFVTYFPKYAFNPKTRELTELGDAKPGSAQIDYGAAAAWTCNSWDKLRLEPLGDGKWRYMGGPFGRDGIVSSQQELEDEVVKALAALCFDDDLDEVSYHCSKTEFAECSRLLAEARESYVQQMACSAWEAAHGKGTPRMVDVSSR